MNRFSIEIDLDQEEFYGNNIRKICLSNPKGWFLVDNRSFF